VAGLGRKVFVAGEILQAAELQGYAVDQSVMVFDDATARTAAIPSPTEGMVTYLKSDDQVTVFDGAAFKPVGGLVAVKSALKTDTFSASVTAGNNVAVDGLSITHEMQDAANKLIISAFFGVAANSSGDSAVGIAVNDSVSGLLTIGNSAGSRTRVTTGGPVFPTGSSFATTMPSLSLVHAPGSTASRTYTVRAINLSASTRTLFVNRGQGDSDDISVPRGASAIVIQEVAV
jgi:hypothetical protein